MDRRDGRLDAYAGTGRQMRAASFLVLAGGSLLAACTANEPAPTSTPTTQKVDSCEALAGMALKDGKIDAATSLAGRDGQYGGGQAWPSGPPAFCLVQATLSPVPGSSSKVEGGCPSARLEWQTAARGQRRLWREHLLPSLLMAAQCKRLCSGRHRHGGCRRKRRGRKLGAERAREDPRLWLARQPRRRRDRKQVIAAFTKARLRRAISTVVRTAGGRHDPRAALSRGL